MSEPELLKVLLHESAQARDDERNMFAQNALLIPGVLMIVGGLSVLFYQTCVSGDAGCHPDKVIAYVPSWVYVCAPLLPIAMVAYMAFLSRVMALRSYYLRVLELSIHRMTNQDASAFPVPSWSHISLEVAGPARAELASKLNLLLIFGISALMLVGCVWIAIWRIPDIRLSVFAFVLDFALMAIPVAIAVSNVVGGANLWDRALTKLGERLSRTARAFRKDEPSELHAEDASRSLMGYLILPRNQEEILKCLFIPICFCLGWVIGLSRPDGNLIWYYVGFFFVFELLVYQARYLWNDIRDRAIDNNPATHKRRLPFVVRRGQSYRQDWTDSNEVRAAFGSFVIRLSLAFLIIGLLLPIDDSKLVWHFAFVLSVFVIAYLYERTREKCNAEARKKFSGKLTLWANFLVGIVGFGYGLRAVVGLWLLLGRQDPSLVYLFVCASLFGSEFVALTWALESTRCEVADLRASKAHLVPFRKSICGRMSGQTINESTRVLSGRQNPLAFWNWPTILATPALGMLILWLLQLSHPALLLLKWLHSDIAIYISAFFAGELIIGMIATSVSARTGLIIYRVPLSPALCVTLLNFVAFTVLLLLLHTSAVGAAILGLIASLPLLTSCFFRTRSFSELPNVMGRLLNNLQSGCKGFYQWFVKPRLEGMDENFPAASPNSVVGDHGKSV